MTDDVRDAYLRAYDFDYSRNVFYSRKPPNRNSFELVNSGSVAAVQYNGR